ncbi:hypothetical protein ILYODFUR_028541 [Ilyodon furcidens]|uniref:Uncharacterized protein n=1 Tax=Ilyodon furcidens TaxID=33524 RepID=A0ABV0VKX5_9TELE
MPQPAPCLTSLIDPVSVPELLSLKSPVSHLSFTCAVEITACHPLRFPLWASSSTQDKSSDSRKLCGVLPK